MSISLKKYSYRFAEQVFNGKVALKNELEDILYDTTKKSRQFNTSKLQQNSWSRFQSTWLECQPPVFGAADDAYARFDFLKDRIGVEVQFGHSSFIGIDLLKFQAASYSSLDTIDFGVYITTTGIPEALAI